MKKIKLLAILLLSILILDGCGKPKEPFTKNEMEKAYQTFEKHKILLGTGYWSHIISMKVEINNDVPSFIFYMGSSYWSISDTKLRIQNDLAYRKMQRGFEKQINLKRKIVIHTR